MTNHVRRHPPQMTRTSAMIGRNIAAIQNGRNRGEFPALDRILTPQPTTDPPGGVIRDVYYLIVHRNRCIKVVNMVK